MAGGERVIVTTFAKIVLSSVEDNGTADDRVLAVERDLRIRHGGVDVSIRIRNRVPEVSHMTLVISRPAVGLSERVEMPARRLAPVRQVTVLVDVEPVVSLRDTVDLNSDRSLGLCKHISQSVT